MSNIGQPLTGGNFDQGLHFALRQGVVQGLAVGGGQVVHQHLGHFCGDVLATLVNGAHRGDDFCGVARLVQVALCACAQTADGVLVFGVHGHHQHLKRQVEVAQRLQHLNAAAAGQIKVQH